MRPVYCEGPPREIGRVIGKSFRAEILRTLDGHDGLNTRFTPYSRAAAGRARYHHLVALHRSRTQDLISELEGMAEGAGVPLEKLLVINLRGEYQRFAFGGNEPGCSTCSLLSPDTAAFGHNEDGLVLYRGQTYLVRARPRDKPAFTATGFSDNAEHLSFFEEEGNIVDGGGRAVKSIKIGFEFFDIEQMGVGDHGYACRAYPML